jgi:hypothetical protein
LCDEHGIGGDRKYCGDNDAQLDRINVFNHEASGDKYVPRTVLSYLEPGAIDAVRALPLGKLFRPGNLVNHTRGQNFGIDVVVVVVVVVCSQVSGTARAQKFKAGEERAVSNLESTPKESNQLGFCCLPLGCGTKWGAMRAMASLGCGGAVRAIVPSIPQNTCPRQGRRRPTPRFCAAGANGTNMHKWWSTRRKSTAILKNSSKVRRRED